MIHPLCPQWGADVVLGPRCTSLSYVWETFRSCSQVLQFQPVIEISSSLGEQEALNPVWIFHLSSGDVLYLSRGFLNGVWSGWSDVSYTIFDLTLQALIRTVYLSQCSSGDDKEPQEDRGASLAIWGHFSLLLISSLSYPCLPSTLLLPADRRERTHLLNLHLFLPHHCFLGTAFKPNRSPFTSETIIFLWFIICFKD